MRIDAITVCVDYADQLKVSLPIRLDTLESVTIVTTPTDPANEFQGSNLTIVHTDVFYKFEAWFNKGAALNVGYAHANPKDWCLFFDADVEPFPTWREKIIHLDPLKLYGISRIPWTVRVTKSHQGISRNSRPVGYFQLWHTKHSAGLYWPLHSNHYNYAGAYDIDFMKRWSIRHWSNIAGAVKHLSPGRTNWFGVNNTEIMKRVQRGHKVTILPLKPPVPKIKLYLNSENDEWKQNCLEISRKFDQFELSIIGCGRFPTGYESISESVTPNDLQTLLKESLNGG
jgi:glycosyltransferase involved in cell wall biosynthesis